MRGAHEDLYREDRPHSSSNRTFGLVLAIFFALVAFLPLVRGHAIRWWAVPFCALFLVTALLAPAVLSPLNGAWTLLGRLLHRITNPVILAVCFYCIFTPFGWLLRLAGKDFLRLKRDSQATSYWIVRQPPGPSPESMANQF